ncbi:MAG: hypothetical protein AB1Z50_01835 [Desulfuromonadales bacterium]
MVQGLSLKFAAGYHVAVWLAKEYKLMPSGGTRAAGSALKIQMQSKRATD